MIFKRHLNRHQRGTLDRMEAHVYALVEEQNRMLEMYPAPDDEQADTDTETTDKPPA